jgi:hypothetical protein
MKEQGVRHLGEEQEANDEEYLFVRPQWDDPDGVGFPFRLRETTLMLPVIFG